MGKQVRSVRVGDTVYLPSVEGTIQVTQVKTLTGLKTDDRSYEIPLIQLSWFDPHIGRCNILLPPDFDLEI